MSIILIILLSKYAAAEEEEPENGAVSSSAVPPVVSSSTSTPVTTTPLVSSSAQPIPMTSATSQQPQPTTTQPVSEVSDDGSLPTATQAATEMTNNIAFIMSTQSLVPSPSVPFVPAQPNPTGLPAPKSVSEIQRGTVNGEVQGEDVPAATVSGSVSSLPAGKVVWQVLVPEGCDTQFYFPVKLGIVLPYAWLAAFRKDFALLSKSETTFMATTTLTYPGGFKLIVQFDSYGFGPSGVASFAIRANGFYNGPTDLERVRSLTLPLKQSQDGVIAGSTTLSGNVLLKFEISGTGTDGSLSLPFSPVNLRVFLSTIKGMSKRASDHSTLTFSSDSSFQKPPQPIPPSLLSEWWLRLIEAILGRARNRG